MNITEERTLHNIKCDCCGAVYEDNWAETQTSALEKSHDEGFINIDGRDYCPKCYNYDREKDIIVTKDGRVY